MGNVNVKTYDDRIQTLYSQYDQDQDNILNIESFIAFFEEACDIRPSTVWLNLKSCKFRYDFEHMDSIETDTLKLDTLPRHHLSTNKDFIKSLLSLLQE